MQRLRSYWVILGAARRNATTSAGPTPRWSRQPTGYLCASLPRSTLGCLPSVKWRLTLAACRITFPLVIRSFRNWALRRYFEASDPSGLSVPNVARVSRMLRALDAAGRPEDVNLPSFHRHPLQSESRWSIRVTGNWRITFAWGGADAVAVDLEDYH
jgi:toxin HigB-1